MGDAFCYFGHQYRLVSNITVADFSMIELKFIFLIVFKILTENSPRVNIKAFNFDVFAILWFRSKYKSDDLFEVYFGPDFVSDFRFQGFKIMWRSKTELLFFTRDLLASRQMEIERWFLQASL